MLRLTVEYSRSPGLRVHVNPSFETQSELLQRTIIEQDGERVALPDESLKPEHLEQHNASLVWV